jgi:hypothetical protein
MMYVDKKRKNSISVCGEAQIKEKAKMNSMVLGWSYRTPTWT